MTESFVLDASAILYLINAEMGAERVAEVMPGSVVSAVNLSEVVAKLSELGSDRTRLEALLASLGLTVQTFDAHAAYAAAACGRGPKRSACPSRIAHALPWLGA
jgi:ribonuclease VapC